jgi:hypothetical protein
MRPGDLVQFKAPRSVLEIGGHRYLDNKRHWWVDYAQPAEPTIDEVFVLIEKDPKLYGFEADRLKDVKPVIIVSSKTNRILVTSQKEIRIVGRVRTTKK